MVAGQQVTHDVEADWVLNHQDARAIWRDFSRLDWAAPKENEIPFIFKGEKGNTTFYQGLPL
jgi:hypothetical protein